MMPKAKRSPTSTEGKAPGKERRARTWPRGQAVGARHLDQRPVDVADAVEGVEVDREGDADRDQEQLGLLVDPEPQDHERDDREVQDVAQHLQRENRARAPRPGRRRSAARARSPGCRRPRARSPPAGCWRRRARRTPLASVSQNARAVPLGAGSTRAESRPSREALPRRARADRQEQGVSRSAASAQRGPHETALACCTGRVGRHLAEQTRVAHRLPPGRSWPSAAGAGRRARRNGSTPRGAR